VNKDIKKFDREWRTGDRAKAKGLAKSYVDAHREEINKLLAPYTREQLVELIDQYRQVGREEDRLVVDMYLLSEYEPQKITGELNIGGAIDEVTRLVNKE
jgi:hypothetical protein